VGRRDAREIADDVLFPAADEVDRADRVPAAHFDLLAAEGFYGLSRFDELAPAVEAFAGGCLATAFVWTQHRGPLAASAGTAWFDVLARGECRAGIALVGLRTPQPLRVRRTGGDFVLDGSVPFVTGWGLVDLLMVAARDADDLVHFLFVDADPGPTVAVRRLDLVAANASRTVTLAFDGHRVPASRLMSTEPMGEWTAADASGSALNGFLALGVAGRCCRLLGPGPLDADVAAARAVLTAAGRSGTGIAAARAMSSDVAWRAAGALTARTGSRAVLAGHPAQRLAREATLMLAFGTRPSIRDSLVARLGG
jgi:alkylation response protein AidB-like acyl-CoA dehydrogenase